MRQAFFVLPSAEIAVEIDPRTLTAEMVEAMRLSGVNRASLGVQSFDPVVQRAINRVQSFEQTHSVVDMLRRAGINGINFDLIYGLPHQTVASCLDTVRRSLELQPDRFSVFGYAHVPDFKKHQRMIKENHLPDGPARHDQACAIANALKDAGYVQIGLDHFARPADPMAVAFAERTLRRNFQGYTTDNADALIGLGASAIGRLPQGFVQNAPDLGAYGRAITAGAFATARGIALSADDRLRGAIIERLMCDFAVDLETIAGYQALPDALAALQPLERDGLVATAGARVTVTAAGRPFVRLVAAAFDAYLGHGTARHSRAV
jgi:oxygen-independent coproporphyrinogen-3 oxidase